MQSSSKSMIGTLRYLALVLICSLGMAAHDAVAAGCKKPWPAWDAFKKNQISQEGRVLDSRSDELRSTSQGQAYAMFFALAANDRATFDRLLEWSETHLAQGDLTAHLPSGQWGKTDEGDWAVLDAKSTPEADLWMAYVLGEAGRLWNDRRYVALASLLADRILNEESAAVAKQNFARLPGAAGSSADAPPLMRWFAEHGKDPRWTALAAGLKNATERQRIEAQPDHYYDQILSMYAQGLLDNLYRFDLNGNTIPRWTSSCQ